jgi:hypothetical protein
VNNIFVQVATLSVRCTASSEALAKEDSLSHSYFATEDCNFFFVENEFFGRVATRVHKQIVLPYSARKTDIFNSDMDHEIGFALRWLNQTDEKWSWASAFAQDQLSRM